METLPLLKASDIKPGMKVLVRLDLNVPLKNGKVGDTFRIEQAVRTLEMIQKKKGRAIVVSHLGDSSATLEPVAKILEKKLGRVSFSPYVIGDRALHSVNSMKDGDILILENIRSQKGEEDNAPSFARALARFGDIFVQDGFAVSHRKHASIVGLPSFLPSFIGPEFEQEIKNLQSALEPKHPSVLILGGSKFSTKLPLLKKYVKKADTIFLVGALAHNVLKARGVDVGLSLIDTSVPVPSTITKATNIFVPIDAILESGKIVDINHVGMRDKIVDAGPATVALIAEKLKSAKTIIMNGPLGLYEEGYISATKAVLKQITLAKGDAILGGGDTVAMARSLKLDKKIKFISTGGGAMLDYLSNETLPGLDAVKRKSAQKEQKPGKN